MGPLILIEVWAFFWRVDLQKVEVSWVLGIYISIYSRSGTQPHPFDFLILQMNLPVKKGGDSVLSVDIHQSQLQLRCQVPWFVSSGQIITTKTPVGHLKWWWKVRESTQNPRNIQVWELYNLPSFIVFGGLLVCSLVGCEKNVKHDSRVTKRSWHDVTGGSCPTSCNGLGGSFPFFWSDGFTYI